MFACESTIEVLIEASMETQIPCDFVVIGNHPQYPSLMDILALQTEEEVDNFVYSEPKNSITEPSIIFFSSGTTGVPKGTVLPSDAIVNSHMNRFYWKEKSILYWVMNIFWSTGVHFLIACIKLNSTRIVVKDFDPDKACRIINKYKV